MTDKQSTEHSPEPFDDELLSAYIDGELSGPQLDFVERHLESDPCAAVLVEQLRAMREQLQALPRENVGEDLRAVILQRAERAMLLGAEGAAAAARRETSWRRPWVWASLAVAASLLLVVYLPVAQQRERPLARVEPADGGPEHDEPADQSFDRLRLEAMRANEGKATSAAPAGVVIDLDSDANTDGNLESRSVPDRAVGPQTKAAESYRTARQDGATERLSAVEATASDFKQEIETAEPFLPTCLVYITLSDNDSAGEQFEKLLVGNGIEFRADSTRPVPSPNGLATFAKEQAPDAATDSVARRDAERGVESAAQREASARNTETKENLDFAANDAEPVQLVLVETTTAQIEEVLEACNADTLHWDQIRVTEQRASELPIAQWRQQYERSQNQLSENQLRRLKGKVTAAKKRGQGWATRLDTKQYQAGKLNIDRKLFDLARPAATADSPPVQVLFVLQQSTGATPSTSEPAEPGR